MGTAHLAGSANETGADIGAETRFGGIPLKRQKTAVIVDRAPGRDPYPGKKIITRLQRNMRELCQHSGQVEVHHVARLANLAYPGAGQPASTGT